MDSDWMIAAAYGYAAFLGAALGSFYFALATRVSYYFYSKNRKKLPGRANRFRAILFQPSFCMECGSPIKRLHLIPVLGFFLARGRCAHCKKPITAWHVLAEVYCMLLLPWLLFQGTGWPFAIVCTLFAGHIIISMLTDLRHFVLDHENTAVLLILAAAKVFLDSEPAAPSVLTALFVLLFFGSAYAVYQWLGRAGLGAGDILFSTAVGGITGFPDSLPVFGAAGAFAILYSIRRRRESASEAREPAPAPFGACLGAAVLLWLLLKPVILSLEI